jgi:predicted DNA-binding transcriptional regulator YafY
MKDFTFRHLLNLGDTVYTCTYTNWKGETEERTIIPEEIRFGSCKPWHPEEQWLMYAWDCKKKVYREFAMNKMTNMKVLDE